MYRLLILVLPALLLCPVAWADGPVAISKAGMDAMEGRQFVAEGWRFTYGDNPAYAAPSYNDRNWNVGRSVLFSDAARNGIGWFRLRLDVKPDLLSRPLSARIYALGAAEVFLDGKLLFRHGTVSPDGTNEDRRMRISVHAMPRLTPGAHVLAVRFSNHKVPSYLRTRGAVGFYLQIGYSEILNQEARNESARSLFGMFCIGLYIAFALIHLMLYFSYRALRANLYFSLMIFSMACITYFDLEITRFLGRAETQLIEPIVLPISILAATCAGQAFLLSVVYGKLPRFFYYSAAPALVLGVLTFFFGLRVYQPYIALYALFGVLSLLVILYIGIRRTRAHLRLISTGIVMLVVGFAWPLMAVAGIVPYDERMETWPYILTFGLLISLSAYLARTFGDMNRTLSRQLQEVKTLSAQTLEQERKAQYHDLQRRILEAEYQRKLQELEDARELQLSMLPREMPSHPEYEMAAYMTTATEVGGDYYDFHQHGDGALLVAIGDATGHGLLAGMMVAATKSLFGALEHERDLLAIIKPASIALKRLKFRRMYMGLTLARLHGDTVEMVAAGMPPVLIHRAQSSGVEILRLRGMPLGSFPEFPYETCTTPFLPGDTLLFLTDGYLELFDDQREMLGEERAADVFRTIAGEPPEAIIRELTRLANEWTQGQAPADDMTFLVIRRRNGKTARPDGP